MNTAIRPETPADYAAVADLHARAFGRAAEALIVALLRQSTQYDPALSLVAEEGNVIIGHALWLPYAVQVLGQAVPAINLAPLAVLPGHQGRGIGGALIAAGHQAARARGAAFSFLLGHPSYYPRFGYQTGAFGSSRLVLDTANLPATHLVARPPAAADLPALQALWQHEEGAVDLSLAPGPRLMDWLSSHPAIRTAVWLDGAAIVGYTRVADWQPGAPRMFLARDAVAARAVAAALAQPPAGPPLPALELPLHPQSASAALGRAEATAWQAAMVCPLAPSPLDRYLTELRAGTRPPGRLIWPAPFDIAA